MERIDELADDVMLFSMNDMYRMQENRPKNVNKPKRMNFDGMTNDDDIIDYFLDNNTQFVICDYF